MKRVPLTQGKYAIVDNIDYDYLMQWKWCYAKYALHHDCVSKKNIFMHVVIAERMGLDTSQEIDHHNQNKLDNQRRNLRPASERQQRGNTGLQKNNKSGYKGVSWHKQSAKWQAVIRVAGKLKHLGCFDNQREAAEAYNKAAKKHFGKFAWLNLV
jgi:hypothetical protein